jgi:hypothetical protein
VPRAFGPGITWKSAPGSAERQLGTVEIKNAELALGDPGETHVPRHHDL